MFIKLDVNTPDSGAVVLVKMDDGTPEKECYAVAQYEPERLSHLPISRRFTPINVSPVSIYSGTHEVEIDFDVVSWIGLNSIGI